MRAQARPRLTIRAVHMNHVVSMKAASTHQNPTSAADGQAIIAGEPTTSIAARQRRGDPRRWRPAGTGAYSHIPQGRSWRFRPAELLDEAFSPRLGDQRIEHVAPGQGRSAPLAGVAVRVGRTGRPDEDPAPASAAETAHLGGTLVRGAGRG
jgi:hypothetical protein